MAQSELFPSHAKIFLETIFLHKRTEDSFFFPEGSARAFPKYINRKKKNYTEKLHTRSKKKKKTTNNRPLSWKELAPTTEEYRVRIFEVCKFDVLYLYSLALCSCIYILQ
jgi:hypothetical protein